MTNAEYQRIWRAKNKTRCLQWQRTYYKNNPHKFALYRNKSRQYTLEYMTKRKIGNKKIVDTLKANPCSDCHKTYPVYVLQFDHVRGVKKFDISEGLTHAIKNILQEIEKCELVCANCHAIRTFRRRNEQISNSSILSTSRT